MPRSRVRSTLRSVATVAGLGTALVSIAAPQVHAATATTKKTVKKRVSTAPLHVDGPVVDTRWGPVQVSITVTAGRLTDVTVPIYPAEKRRSAMINEYALPILHDEAVAAQSARIQNISGATVTWRAYTASLQKALDAAKVTGTQVAA
jgi:uncharacterized protein with FMN-binding domain